MSQKQHKVLVELSEMTQEQKEEFVSAFNAINAINTKSQLNVYLRNGIPVIKASTLPGLLGWKHGNIIGEIKRRLTNGESSHFFETDSPRLDYEVTRDGYQALVNELGVRNQEQANNDDAICTVFDSFEAISNTAMPLPPEEIALAVEMVEDLLQKHIGHLTFGAVFEQLYQDHDKYQHHQRLLEMVYLTFIDGCLFIADRCPLIDYDLLSWHPDAQRDIPHDYEYAVRPSIMIRLFDSTIDSDIPY